MYETVQGMQCSATIIPGEYTIHWKPSPDGVNITCLASGSGYVGLGWTANQGQMIGSHAILGWVNNDGSQMVNKLADGCSDNQHPFREDVCSAQAIAQDHLASLTCFRTQCSQWPQ